MFYGFDSSLWVKTTIRMLAMTAFFSILQAAPVVTINKMVVSEGQTGLTASVPIQTGAQYLWTVDNGEITSSSTNLYSISFKAGSPGTTKVSCLVVNSDGIASKGDQTIAVRPIPVATIAAPGYVGKNNLFSASVPLQEGKTYNWTTYSVYAEIIGDNTNNSITFRSGSSSSAIIFCTVTDPTLGMSIQGSKTIKLLAIPNFSINSSVASNSTGWGVFTTSIATMGYNLKWQISGNARLMGGTCLAPYTIDREAAYAAKVMAFGKPGETYVLSCTAEDYVGQEYTATKQCSISTNSGVGVSSLQYVTPGDTGLNSYIRQYACDSWLDNPENSWGSDGLEITSNQSRECLFNIPENITSGYPSSKHITASILSMRQSSLGGNCDQTIVLPYTFSSTLFILQPPSALITASQSTAEGAAGLKASVPMVNTNVADPTQYLWSIDNGVITDGIGTNSITFQAGAVGILTLGCKVISPADRSIFGTFSMPVYPTPIAKILVPDLSEPVGATERVASVPFQQGMNYSWTITGGTITSSVGTNSIRYTVTAPIGGKVVLTCRVQDASNAKAVTGTQSVSVTEKMFADLAIVKSDGSEIPEIDEETIGKVLQVNIQENPDAPPQMNELLKLKLHKLSPSGLSGVYYRLHFLSKNIAIWKDTNRSQLVENENSTFSADEDTVLFVEGIKPSLTMQGEIIELQAILDDKLIKSDRVKVIVAKMIFVILGDENSSENEAQGIDIIREMLEDPSMSAEKIKFSPDGKPNLYLLKSADACFSISIGYTELFAKAALSADNGYVVYDGHSNFGLGFSFSKNLKRLSDFMNIGEELIDINWSYMRRPHTDQQEGQDHPELMIYDALDYGDWIDSEELYDPLAGLKVIGGHIYPDQQRNLFLSKQPTGMNLPSLHLVRSLDSSAPWYDHHYFPSSPNAIDRLIVKGGSEDLPTMGWTKLFLNCCNSGNYFLRVFKHGTVFFTLTTVRSRLSTAAFIKAVIEGKNDEAINDAITAAENIQNDPELQNVNDFKEHTN